MILDGYNMEGAVLDGFTPVRLVYRPMLSPERRQFLRAFHEWEDRDCLGLVCDWLRRHLVASSLSCDLGDLYYDNRPLFQRIRRVLVGVSGCDDAPWNKRWEADDVANLQAGVRLHIVEPSLARRTCRDCLKFFWEEDTGRIIERNGHRIERPVEAPPMCQLHDGCPVGTPENQSGRLSLRNAEAFNHFRMCQAVGQFPDDPIVARNALVIQTALSQAFKEKRDGRAGHDATGDGGGGIGPLGGTVAARRDSLGGSVDFFWNPFGQQQVGSGT